jgi:hypothetical protein
MDPLITGGLWVFFIAIWTLFQIWYMGKSWPFDDAHVKLHPRFHCPSKFYTPDNGALREEKVVVIPLHIAGSSLRSIECTGL